jgi:hypothetical protein
VRRLGGAFDEAALAQEAAFDRIRRDENIGRLRMKMVFRRAEKAKALFGDLEIARSRLVGDLSLLMIVPGCCVHTVAVLLVPMLLISLLLVAMLLPALLVAMVLVVMLRSFHVS